MRPCSFHPLHGLIYWLVFPDPYDHPSIGPKLVGHPLISPLVPRQLRTPVARICPWLVPMLWASVPEAAIDEDGDPIARENNIGLNPRSRRSLELMVLSKAKAKGVKG